MRIAVIGLGGVGGYFGGRLSLTNPEVYFIARGSHLAAIQQEGLHVSSDLGDFIAKPALATDDPQQIGTVDVIVVATKAWQVTESIEQMRPLVGENTVFVPLLNGVEAPMQLSEAFDKEHVLGGFCRVMSWIEAPGRVHQGGIQPYVAFGEMDGSKSARVEGLLEIFRAAQINTEVPANIQAAMWQKFVFIAALSGVGSVTRMPAGVLRNLPQTRQMIEDAMQEIKAVAEGRGIPMSADAVTKGMHAVDTLPAEGTASMQRDMMDGKPSELEAQNGAVVRLGAEVGVDTPTHRFLYHALLPMELRGRGQV